MTTFTNYIIPIPHLPYRNCNILSFQYLSILWIRHTTWWIKTTYLSNKFSILTHISSRLREHQHLARLPLHKTSSLNFNPWAKQYWWLVLIIIIKDHTRLQAVVYGSFDHPSLIRYDQLHADLIQYLQTQTRQYPQYSFKDSRVTSYQTISWKYDIIIIEGLYTISQLPEIPQELKIIVTSDTEELMIRRLVRDQQRTHDTASQIVQTLESVFSMRNVFGKIQEQQADIVVHNTYDILSDKGIVVELVACDKPSDTLDAYQHHNYVYDDPRNPDKDHIQVTEVYPKQGGMLDHTSLYKIKPHQDIANTNKSESISKNMAWLHNYIHLCNWLDSKSPHNQHKNGIAMVIYTICTKSDNGIITPLLKLFW
jgi:uridine kinase